MSNFIHVYLLILVKSPLANLFRKINSVHKKPNNLNDFYFKQREAKSQWVSEDTREGIRAIVTMHNNFIKENSENRNEQQRSFGTMKNMTKYKRQLR